METTIQELQAVITEQAIEISRLRTQVSQATQLADSLARQIKEPKLTGGQPEAKVQKSREKTKQVEVEQ